MMKPDSLRRLLGAALVGACGLAAPACGDAPAPRGVTHRQMADALHAVIEADRTIYAKEVVHRLVNEEKRIKASEAWKDEQTLPLPAQMLRMGAELAADKNDGFNYALLSLWPINPQNRPRTPAEKQGLQAVVEQRANNFYGEETLGGRRYFTAVYADVAVSKGCVLCHNNHKDSPRKDFKLNDVMGGLVIRIPIQP